MDSAHPPQLHRRPGGNARVRRGAADGTLQRRPLPFFFFFPVGRHTPLSSMLISLCGLLLFFPPLRNPRGQDKANARFNGLGREEPNLYPTLPGSSARAVCGHVVGRTMVVLVRRGKWVSPRLDGCTLRPVGDAYRALPHRSTTTPFRLPLSPTPLPIAFSPSLCCTGGQNRCGRTRLRRGDSTCLPRSGGRSTASRSLPAHAAPAFAAFSSSSSS